MVKQAKGVVGCNCTVTARVPVEAGNRSIQLFTEEKLENGFMKSEWNIFLLFLLRCCLLLLPLVGLSSGVLSLLQASCVRFTQLNIFFYYWPIKHALLLVGGENLGVERALLFLRQRQWGQPLRLPNSVMIIDQ